jgi:alpha-tubulin suppressor-like RCC1 family protein
LLQATWLASSNADFVAIAAGADYSLGLRADSSIAVWGVNSFVPAPNTDFVAIASGQRHNLGLKRDGSVVAWGFNGNGQCNVPDATRRSWRSREAGITAWA